MKKLVLVALQILFVTHVKSWNEGSVLLRDVQALTLYKGRYSTGRRSSPVLQLQCVGGSAGCSAFVPDVVQCQNRGWDGVSVQWECKTQMDKAYRFGKVEVNCEGFNHPDDPYILTGSCGLKYTLELTAEGRRKEESPNPWVTLLVILVLGFVMKCLSETNVMKTLLEILFDGKSDSSKTEPPSTSTGTYTALGFGGTTTR